MALGIDFDQSQALRTVAVLERLPRQLTRDMAVAVRESAKGVAQQTRVLLRRKRFRGRRGKGGGAAAPGEPPALRTGARVRSGGFRKVRRDGLAYVAEAKEFYARFLEVPKDGAAKHPFISIAVENRQDQIEARLVAAITGTLEQAAKR